MDIRTRAFTAFFLLILGGFLKMFPQGSKLPGEFRQIIPRGAIPAIIDPEYVPAQEADIGDEAWILGVVINGQPRAYSLNLLNNHEIVNDQIGETPFAAVW